MTRAEWKAEFERSHLPKYEAQERRLKRDFESSVSRGSSIAPFVIAALMLLFVFWPVLK
jgi:hypothetical protein